MSIPTTETSPALAAVDFGSMNTREPSKVRAWAAPTLPIAGPETYLEVLEGLLGRWEWAVAHDGD